MNSIWVDVSKPVVAMMLVTLAVLLITVLFVLLRGGLTNYSAEFNAMIVVGTIVASIALFIGGTIFFHFSLALTRNSSKFRVAGLRNQKHISKYDKAFYKSCRHISMYIGSFFPAKNRALPLMFFGQIVVKTTIDLLLTFR